ncbi:thioredoxin family protein [Alishewanella sp. HL-SH06]|uniref:thioredoxin family protein n=1 Tax=Alishewanella sp. HL-SH06 TaxID=3461144 RepID=UPI0040417A72
MLSTSLKTFAIAATFAVALFTAPQVNATNFVLPAYSAAQLVEAEKQGSFVLVATKPGCPVCAKQVPVIEALLKDPAFSDLKVLQYNQVTEKALNNRYGVTGQSTIIVVNKGELVSLTRGLTDEQAIKAEMLKAL